MKRAFVTAAFLIACVSNEAAAQSPPVRAGATVVYVSGQRLSNESVDGQVGLRRVQALQQQKTTELRTMTQALDSTRRELAQAVDSEARARLQQQELQQRSELERSTAQAQQEIQKLQRDMASELQAKVRSEITELVKGTDIQIVVQLESLIVWAAPGLDLTPAVIQRLNAKSGGAVPGAAQ